jgi:hypothetical protein
MFFGFVYPVFYANNSLLSAKSYNAYAGAPYVSFLQTRNREQYRVFGRDNALYPNWAGAFGLTDVRDLDAMFYRRYIKFVRAFLLEAGDESRVHGELADRFTGNGDGYTYDLTTDLEQRFLALSSVKYVISSNALLPGVTGRLPGGTVSNRPFREIYEREVTISEFRFALPRASLFYSAVVLPDEGVIARLKDPTFDPLKQVIISAPSDPPEAAGGPGPFAAAAPVQAQAARIVSYDSQHVQIETEGDAPAILMLNDTNYPGWVATVNAQPVAILTADYLFRAVVVPAGHATVEFTYAPLSFRFGTLISIASLIVLVTPMLLRRRRLRSNADMLGIGSVGSAP